MKLRPRQAFQSPFQPMKLRVMHCHPLGLRWEPGRQGPCPTGAVNGQQPTKQKPGLSKASVARRGTRKSRELLYRSHEEIRIGSPEERLERARGWRRETATRLLYGQDTHDSRRSRRVQSSLWPGLSSGTRSEGNIPYASASLGAERKGTLQPLPRGEPRSRELVAKAMHISKRLLQDQC